MDEDHIEFDGGFTLILGVHNLREGAYSSMNCFHETILHEREGRKYSVEVLFHTGTEDAQFLNGDPIKIKTSSIYRGSLDGIILNDINRVIQYDTGCPMMGVYDFKVFPSQNELLLHYTAIEKGIEREEAIEEVFGIIEVLESPFVDNPEAGVIYFWNPETNERAALIVSNLKNPSTKWRENQLEWSTFSPAPAVAAAKWLEEKTKEPHRGFIPSQHFGIYPLPPQALKTVTQFSSYSEAEWEAARELGHLPMPIRWAKMVPHKENEPYSICM